MWHQRTDCTVLSDTDQPLQADSFVRGIKSHSVQGPPREQEAGLEQVLAHTCSGSHTLVTATGMNRETSCGACLAQATVHMRRP